MVSPLSQPQNKDEDELGFETLSLSSYSHSDFMDKIFYYTVRTKTENANVTGNTDVGSC